MKLIWPLANAREVPYSLSTPGGQIWAYFCSTHSDFKDIWADFQNLTYLSMQLCHWQKFQKLHIESLCISGAQNCAYFRSTNRGIWDTDRFLKIFIFRNKTWLLSKVRGVAHTLLFYPGGGVGIELMFILWAAVSEIQADFQKLPYLGMKLGHSQSCPVAGVCADARFTIFTNTYLNDYWISLCKPLSNLYALWNSGKTHPVLRMYWNAMNIGVWLCGWVGGVGSIFFGKLLVWRGVYWCGRPCLVPSIDQCCIWDWGS